MPQDKSIETAILRILDANLNRAGEGIRFLEEVARLALDDSRLTGELKALRHGLLACSGENNARLLGARDSVQDVGTPLPDMEANRERDLASLVVANARRVQEALRVMEELDKVPGLWHHSERYKAARFQIYNLEQSLLSRLLRQDRLSRIGGVHLIIENDASMSKVIEIAQRALEQGVRVIRLEITSGPAQRVLDLARTLVSLCKEKGALFIMQGRLDMALAAPADGLHLRPDDLSIDTVRPLLPLGTIIGIEVNNKESAMKAQKEGADYIECSSRDLHRIPRAITLPLVTTIDISQKSAAPGANAPISGSAIRAAALPPAELAVTLARLIKERERKP